MSERQGADPRRENTIALLGQAYSLLGFRIVDGVSGTGHPIKPSHSAVFAQIEPGGSRLTKLAAGARDDPPVDGCDRRRAGGARLRRRVDPIRRTGGRS